MNSTKVQSEEWPIILIITIVEVVACHHDPLSKRWTCTNPKPWAKNWLKVYLIPYLICENVTPLIQSFLLVPSSSEHHLFIFVVRVKKRMWKYTLSWSRRRRDSVCRLYYSVCNTYTAQWEIFYIISVLRKSHGRIVQWGITSITYISFKNS